MTNPVVPRGGALRRHRSVIRAASVLAATVAAAFAYSGTAAAAPWCGSVAAADRAPVLGGKSIRVIYAIPADGPDQSAQRVPLISADVDSISAWWRSQDYARSPRFDLAAFPCGVQADVVLARLPQAGVELQPAEGRFPMIAAAIAVLGPQPQDSKYLVYYDGPVDDGSLCGQGGGSAEGQGFAIVYTAACTDIASEVVAAHELIHAFGALPAEGPLHPCQDSKAHPCDSTGDALFPYAPFAKLAVLGLDVGHDDYYAHSGTWLDVQDSLWLRHLEAPPALLSVTPSGGGSVTSDQPGLDCVQACSLEWDGGAHVVLQASPDPGKKFVGWSGACTGRNDCDLTVTQAASVHALFAPAAFRLSVSRTGKGLVRSAAVALACPARCAASVESYVPVRLRAVPVRGWKLKRWSGACKGSAPTCRVPMSATAKARAEFVKKVFVKKVVKKK